MLGSPLDPSGTSATKDRLERMRASFQATGQPSVTDGTTGESSRSLTSMDA